MSECSVLDFSAVYTHMDHYNKTPQPDDDHWHYQYRLLTLN